MLEARRNEVSLVGLENLRLQGVEPTGTSINCVGSTHVLVAASTKVDLDIVLLLWDVRYGVLLAEKRVPRPNAVSTIQLDLLRLQISPCNSAQSLLIIFAARPSRHDASTSGLKVVTMVIPHTIPNASTLANAIGRANAGERWIVSADHSPEPKSYEDGREDMLSSVMEAIKNGQLEMADKIFFEWESEQRALVKALVKEQVNRQLAALAPKRVVNGKGDEADLNDPKDAHPDQKGHFQYVSCVNNVFETPIHFHPVLKPN